MSAKWPWEKDGRAGLIQQAIPVVALMRLVAEILDEPLHVGHRHAESCSGLRHDIFLNHDAAEIVRAKFQRDLANFLSLRHPRALHIREIIEVNPAQRLRPQILVRADRW